MNLKKAKSLRKLAKSMVKNELVNAGAAYEYKTFVRKAVLHPTTGEILQGPYNVYTARLTANSEKGVYRSMKRDKALVAAA